MLGEPCNSIPTEELRLLERLPQGFGGAENDI